MKPLPTLTKPLRSVDLETKEPAAALRERTDSCTVPAAAVVAEAMVALVLAGGYREKFGGDHIDDALGGPRRLQGADRVEALSTGALVFIGFMGAGKSSSARSVAAELGTRPARLRPRAGGRAGRADRGRSSTARASPRSARARRSRCCALLERADGGVVALGGGATASERVREALRGHTVVHLEVEPDEAWRRATGKGRPLARDRGRLRPAARRPRGHLRLGGRRRDPARAPRHPAAGAAGAAGAARQRHATRGWCGRVGVARLPGVRGPGPARRRASSIPATAAASR